MSSFSEIASHLSSAGAPSERGNVAWSLSSIKQILRNEKYKGDILFQKTYNIDHLTKKRANNNGQLPQYYLKGSHPPIVDATTWECVQLELHRQATYCQEHHISKYHNHNNEHPLSARITCATCGCTFILLKSKKVGEEGRQYWRCSSFRGKHGTPIEGRTFTPKPMALWSKDTNSRQAEYRAKN